MARIPRMARTPRMARWLADYPDPLRLAFKAFRKNKNTLKNHAL